MASYKARDNATLETLQPYLKQIEGIVGEPVELSRLDRRTTSYGPLHDTEQLAVCDDEPRYYYSFFAVRTQKAYPTFDPYGKAQDRQRVITQWKIVPFPGCCAFCISTEVIVGAPYTRKGVNRVGIQLRQEIARLTGFTGIVCTDLQTNTAERRTLAKAMWKDVYQVTNRRTTNSVNLSVKDLY